MPFWLQCWLIYGDTRWICGWSVQKQENTDQTNDDRQNQDGQGNNVTAQFPFIHHSPPASCP